jgi:hypothetical protein
VITKSPQKFLWWPHALRSQRLDKIFRYRFSENKRINHQPQTTNHKHETVSAFPKMSAFSTERSPWMTTMLILCKVCIITTHEQDQVRMNRNQSKWLHLYWHQSEGIRPPFNRVDSVLLELPYDGLIDRSFICYSGHLLISLHHYSHDFLFCYCFSNKQPQDKQSASVVRMWCDFEYIYSKISSSQSNCDLARTISYNTVRHLTYTKLDCCLPFDDTKDPFRRRCGFWLRSEQEYKPYPFYNHA